MFDFDAYAGALWSLDGAVKRTAGRIGLPREALTEALRKHYAARKQKTEENFWANAHSEKAIGKWLYKHRREFDPQDESEMVELAKQIPWTVRQALIQIAKRSLPPKRGGKAPKLDFIRTWRARLLVREATKKGMSKKKAYEKTAKRMKASAHTIRRICEPKERARSRIQAEKQVAFIRPPQ